MSTNSALGLRLPVESSRKTISSLNSLIQGLFHTPEWSGTYLDLDLSSFNFQSKRIAFDHETETSHDLSRCSSESTASSASAVSEVSETRSMWFNDSPKDSFVELVDDGVSIPTLDSHSPSHSHSHFVSSLSPTHNGSLYFGSEIISSLLSGAHSRSSSISSTRSDLSPIFVPPDVDSSRSVQSSEADLSLSDCLDDELLCSPLESFAAICWDSAVKTDECQAIVAEEKQQEEDVKTVETFDFYNPLQYDEYDDDDDDDSMGDDYPSGMDILSIEYKPVTTSDVSTR